MGSLQASATVRWQGFGGSVEGASGALAARTATQVELGGPGGATNPEELLAAAHANCFTSTLTALARARGLPLEEVETAATTRLEWGERGDHRLAASELRVRLRSAADEQALRALVRDAEAHCPVCNALRRSVSVGVAAEVVR